MYHKTAPYKMFSIFNHTFLAFLALLCILPLIHLLAVSLSGQGPANAGLVTFWPQDFTLEAYHKTFLNPNFLGSLWISVNRTVIGTSLSMAVMLAAAYSLSKGNHILQGRGIYIWYFVLTMLFNGGLIPYYIVINSLGLKNNFWVLVLPGVVSVYNIILLLNFFRTIPKELEDASMIDGAGPFATFWRIFLPLSKPAVATISLFTMVGHWNAYFDGLLFMSTPDKYPLASLIQTIIVKQNFSMIDPADMKLLSQRGLKASQVFIGMLPIMLVYPFLQRYFVKGIVLGAVKE